jgi:hypothetical protein
LPKKLLEYPLNDTGDGGPNVIDEVGKSTLREFCLGKIIGEIIGDIIRDIISDHWH